MIALFVLIFLALMAFVSSHPGVISANSMFCADPVSVSSWFDMVLPVFLTLLSVTFFILPRLVVAVNSDLRSTFEAMDKNQFVSLVLLYFFSFVCTIFTLYMIYIWVNTPSQPIPLPEPIEAISSSSATLIESTNVFASNHPVAAGCGVIVVVGAGVLYLIYRFCGG